MPRSRRNQTEHDTEVARLARSYRRRGYQVQADVPGETWPDPIGGYRPDVVAVKGGHETVVEVETPDSLDTSRDRAQRAAFRKWAGRKSTRHFRTEVTE